MRLPWALLALGLALDAGIAAQNFEQRGFLDNQTLFFPQTTPNDRGHVVNSTLLRWEPSWKLSSWLTLETAFDARTDTHHETERVARLDFDDRSIRRPALSVRRLSALVHKGKFTAEIGRQFIRWGTTDILTPTDRFAPKDYMATVVDSDFLGVAAARVTYDNGTDSIDVVWQPWFTPSRTPLFNQRWTPVPPQAVGVGIIDDGARYPGGSQYGIRWNHIGSGYEYAFVFFDGDKNLPLLDSNYNPLTNSVVLQRYYPKLRLIGGDTAIPLAWFTVKAEAALFTSSTATADEYALYVIQLERQIRQWSLVAGYAGEVVTQSTGNPLLFDPERGFAKSFVAHATWMIGPERNLDIDAVIRAGGSFTRAQYSQDFGQHWRGTVGLAWIRGNMQDFVGEFNHNSYGLLAIRYSF